MEDVIAGAPYLFGVIALVGGIWLLSLLLKYVTHSISDEAMRDILNSTIIDVTGTFDQAIDKKIAILRERAELTESPFDDLIVDNLERVILILRQRGLEVVPDDPTDPEIHG